MYISYHRGHFPQRRFRRNYDVNQQETGDSVNSDVPPGGRKRAKHPSPRLAHTIPSQPQTELAFIRQKSKTIKEKISSHAQTNAQRRGKGEEGGALWWRSGELVGHFAAPKPHLRSTLPKPHFQACFSPTFPSDWNASCVVC